MVVGTVLQGKLRVVEVCGVIARDYNNFAKVCTNKCAYVGQHN